MDFGEVHVLAFLGWPQKFQNRSEISELHKKCSAILYSYENFEHYFSEI